MSSSHHDDHYLQEQKPIAFTVPFILAAVLILIIFLFVSLCDPKPHHGHEMEHHGQMAPASAAGGHHDEGTMTTQEEAGMGSAAKAEHAPAEQQHAH